MRPQLGNRRGKGATVAPQSTSLERQVPFLRTANLDGLESDILDGCEGNGFLSCLLKEDCMMLGWMQGKLRLSVDSSGGC